MHSLIEYMQISVLLSVVATSYNMNYSSTNFVLPLCACIILYNDKKFQKCLNNRFDCSYGFAGITGGLGMPIVIAAVLIVIGCAIMKRRHAPKKSGECS